MQVTGLVRGCGKRKQGGLYLCSDLSPDGQPLEYFLVDPPIAYPTEPFRAPIPVQIPGRAVKDVLVWVGAEYYPHVADFLEETRRFGASRRVPKTFDFSQLSRGSRMFFVHSGAYLQNWEEFNDAHQAQWGELFDCPKFPEPVEGHPEKGGPCAGVFWRTVPLDRTASFAGTRFIRMQEGFEYEVFPAKEFVPKWATGLFLTLPITGVDYIRYADGSVNEDVVEAAQCGAFGVTLCDE